MSKTLTNPAGKTVGSAQDSALALFDQNGRFIGYAGGDNNALKVSGAVRSAEELTAGVPNTNSGAGYTGFYVEAAGGDWTMTLAEDATPIVFTPVAGTFYPYSVSTITPHVSGAGIGHKA